MSIPTEPSLLQKEVQILNAKPRNSLDLVVTWPDIADLSDHCPVVPLQTLEVWFCQWPSLTGMEQCASHTRTGSSSLNFFQMVFTRCG